MPASSQPSRAPRRLAVLVCCAALPLLWVGALVTSHDAGMAVPDWPNTYGYNLFLYPWTTWVYGPWNLFIEHGHRLLGALAGMLSIALVAVVWRREPRAWVRKLALAALGLVVFQGLLGGLRVLLDSRTVAMVHACVGPLFFTLALTLATVTSPRWLAAVPRQTAAAVRVRRLAAVTALVAYLQLLVGAQLRHTPIGANPGDFRTALAFHLALAAVVLVHALLLAAALWRIGGAGALRTLGVGIALAVAAQILLGAGTWLYKFGVPSWLADWGWAADFTVVARSRGQTLLRNAHVVTGSLILALATSAAVRTWGYLRSDAARPAARWRSAGLKGSPA